MCTAEVTTPESISCKSNADCIPVIGICNEIVSINKSFLSKHHELRVKIKPLVLCQNLIPAETYEYSFTECEESECRVRHNPGAKEGRIPLNDIETAKLNTELENILELEKIEKFQECFEGAIRLKNKYKGNDKLEQVFQLCRDKL